MPDHHPLTVLQRLEALEVEFEVLKLAPKNPATRNAKLEIVVRRTVEILRRWQDDKAGELGEDGYDDYAEILVTLPLLEDCLGLPRSRPKEK